jgi:recombination protein RecT
MATQLQTIDRGGAVAALDDTNPYKGLERSLSTRIAGLKDALPRHIDPAKFQRTVMTAAQSNPDLLSADRASLITSCMKCAQDGLLPDGREAALVIYSTRAQQHGEWVTIKTVQYLPMVYGLRKKILQSGEISTLETSVVYRAEVESGAFIFEAGTEAMLRHRPMLDLDDDQITDDCIVAAYSVATMKDGSKSFEVMRRSEINKVRQASQTGATGRVVKFGKDKGKPMEPKGPWVDWFSEMARKTVMRRHSKTLPMSGDLIDMEGADEEAAARSAARLMEVEPDARQLAPPTREESFDPSTGEVETEEQIARRLDAETLRRNDGTLDDENPSAAEGPADEQRGETHAEVDPRRATVDHILGELKIAAVAADLKSIDALYVKHRAALADDQIDEIDAAFATAKARIAKK